MFRNTRTRWAALTSGALIAGGLVVAPAVAGLATASAAPVSLKYTCSGQSPVGPISLPGTVTLDISAPESVAPGEDFASAISAKLDFGKVSMGPVSELTASFAIPLTVGDDTATFTTPSQTAPATALVYSSTGEVDLTAPDAAGEAPITVGTITGNFTAMGLPITASCLPEAGQDQTVGQLVVAEGEPEPQGFDYLCTLTFGGQSYPWDSTLAVDLESPESVEAGKEFDATVNMVLDMGAHTMGPVSSLAGSVDLALAVGDTTTVVTIPTSAGTPESLRFAGTEEVTLVAPDEAGATAIAVGDATGNFTAAPVGMAISIPCVPNEGQDLTVGSIDILEATDPVAVPVKGKVAIDGTPKVGKTLTAVPGKAEGAKVSYQWKANGKVIKKATKKTLKLDKSLKGKKVSVRATYTKSGYEKVVQTSKAVTVKK